MIGPDRNAPVHRSVTGGVFVSILIAALAGCVTGEAEVSDPAFAQADSIIEAWVNEDHISAAALAVVDDGVIVHEQYAGVHQRYDFGRGQYPSAEEVSPRGLITSPDSTPVGPRSVFDLASVTKVMATTMAAMILTDRGELDLDQPVAELLPSFAGSGRDAITARHLLTHTSGLPQWWPVYYHASERDAAWSWLTRQEPTWPVGAERHYSDLGFMVLGRLVEQISGSRLDHFLERELYTPLGLGATGFRPSGEVDDEQNGVVVATSHGNPFERRMVHEADFGYAISGDPEQWSEWRAYTLRGEVNDGNAWHAFDGVAGHAGLFSTADELGVLLSMLLNEGEVLGRRIVEASTVQTFQTRHLDAQALGWQLPSYAPEGSFGHTGFTGTFVLGVPQQGRAIVLLTSRQNPGVDADTQYTDVGPLQRSITDVLTAR